MGDRRQRRNDTSDDGSIVDTPQAKAPVDEQQSRDGARDGDRRLDDRRWGLSDAADPSETPEERRSRIGSAGGGPYPPIPPADERPRNKPTG